MGQWPHAKPADPEVYAASIAATLAGYPLGVVQACCDPRTGLARGREFPPTVAAIVEWCDRKLAFHLQLASWRPRPPQLPAPVYSEEHCAEMRERIAGIPKAYFRPMGAP